MDRMRRQGSSRPSKLKRRRRNAPADRTTVPAPVRAPAPATAGVTDQRRPPPATSASRNNASALPSSTDIKSGSSGARIINSSTKDNLSRFTAGVDGVGSDRSPARSKPPHKTPPSPHSSKLPRPGSENCSTENLLQRNPTLQGKADALDPVVRRKVPPAVATGGVDIEKGAKTGAQMSPKNEGSKLVDNYGTCDGQIQKILEPIIGGKKNSTDAESDGSYNLSLSRELSASDLALDINSKWGNRSKVRNPLAILGLDGSEGAVDTGDEEHQKNIAPLMASAQYIVHHPIIGEICLPVSEAEKPVHEEAFTNIEFRASLGLDECELSFPRRTASDKTNKSRYRMGDGLRVSLSALRFPSVSVNGGTPALKIDGAANESVAGPIDAANKPSATESGLCPSNDQKQENVTATNVNHVGAGTIRIVSERGATIREHYDIDEAKLLLGKLNRNDVRRFVEKKWLPAPDPYSDDSDDEEYLGVTRYKVILSPEDGVLLSDSNGPKYLFGWISDRGRLASENYTILEELPS